ncbi:cobalamin biosynthesis protein CbiD [Subdoligranulum sp. DSM 109015]|uniref:Cobalt-precorrin-5B C(1)-methyltransferase n=1 Tax=Gemmiger gallinarum TaxID=2779354 RepID=A0ABR9R313_9FIRM|nr:cobalt-precorrin-5B (C(1))-methyltransferase CbiD [Gemmiger gallinarum]MBE5037519.1 cobalamin biosynthesis protein CbiD [Gemmiger gallinarum]
MFEHYIQSGGRRLRCGYTTGTCAALAAWGAATLLLTGHAPAQASLITPKGLPVTVPLLDCRADGHTARCSVTKDAGDDADVTDGMPVTAAVERTDAPGIAIDGGEGVGRVTLPGLDQPVGAAAINSVPRKMIAEAVGRAAKDAGYAGGLKVVISVAGGEQAAAKTFNPRLGIVGGISILGTSGIVEPMSEQALIDTIALELRQAAARGAKRVILTPGNYGMDFLQAEGLDRLAPVVKCSNYIGDALDAAAAAGFEEILLVGHAGKLVKLAAGVMNTHSRVADARAEVFCAHAALCGGERELCRALMDAPTSDACLDLLDAAHLRQEVMESILKSIDTKLTARLCAGCRAGAVLFTNQHGLLGQTPQAKEILKAWQ